MVSPRAAPLAVPALAGCLLAACDRDATAPPVSRPPPPAPAYALEPLLDVYHRILPTVEDAGIRAHLHGLLPAAPGEDRAGALDAEALRRARAEVAALLAADAEPVLDPAELDAILLGLDHALSALPSPEER